MNKNRSSKEKKMYRLLYPRRSVLQENFNNLKKVNKNLKRYILYCYPNISYQMDPNVSSFSVCNKIQNQSRRPFMKRGSEKEALRNGKRREFVHKCNCLAIVSYFS